MIDYLNQVLVLFIVHCSLLPLLFAPKLRLSKDSQYQPTPAMQMLPSHVGITMSKTIPTNTCAVERQAITTLCPFDLSYFITMNWLVTCLSKLQAHVCTVQYYHLLFIESLFIHLFCTPPFETSPSCPPFVNCQSSLKRKESLSEEILVVGTDCLRLAVNIDHIDRGLGSQTN